MVMSNSGRASTAPFTGVVRDRQKLSGPSNADPVPTTRSAVKSTVFLEFATKTYTCVCLSGDLPIDHQLLFSMIVSVLIS